MKPATLALLLALVLAVSTCCQARKKSRIDNLLETVTEEQLADIMRGERLDLANCLRVTGNTKTCIVVIRKFIALAQELSHTGYQCEECEPHHQSLIDTFLDTVRGTPNCKFLVEVLPIPDFC